MTSYDENGDPKVMSLEKTQSNTNMTGDEDNDSPIEQVRLTVPPTDDPTQPTLTFRTWVLGLISCVVLSFVNQFFAYRQNRLSITPVIIQILVLPLGKLMAAYLPSKPIRVPLTNWSFSLNPGPFNLKEHVLITIFANSGAGGVCALHIVTGVKAFYHRSISGVAAYILSLTTQMLGYGWAGLFRKYLVDSPICDGLKTWSKSLFPGFDKQLQLPWWGLLMACGIALFFTLPIGIIQATTNTQPGLNVITELVIGYIYPGKPLANVAFNTYGYISLSQALYFVNDFKLGHYMKIPPRSMFIGQLVGTLVASSTYFATAWWLLSSIKDM